MLDSAEANFQFAEEYVAITGGKDKAALASLEQRRLDLEEAYASHDKALEASGASRRAGGSQLEKRMAEEADRQSTRNNRENERELRKLETRPNHFEWSLGSGAISRSQDVRAGADGAIGRAGQLRGKADPGPVAGVRALGKKAKEQAKAAKKAGKRAKDAAKYGTKKEAVAAAVEARIQAEYAEIALNTTLEALKEAEGAAGAGANSSGVLLDPGTGGRKPPASKAVPHLHDCSEDPNVVCQGWVTMSCPTGQKMACHFETPAEEKERKKKGGAKGKGGLGPVLSMDSVVLPMSHSSGLFPEGTGLRMLGNLMKVVSRDDDDTADDFWDNYGEEPEVLATEPRDESFASEGEAFFHEVEVLPDGGLIVRDVNGRDIFVPKDFLDKLKDPIEGTYSMDLWRAAIDEMAEELTAPDFEGVQTEAEAIARLRAAFDEARMEIVNLYTIPKGDPTKLAEIYSHSVAQMARAAGMEWIPGADIILESENTRTVLRDGNATLRDKLAAMGSAALNAIPVGGKIIKFTKKVFKARLTKMATEVATQVVSHEGHSIRLKMLNKDNFRENLRRTLGLTKRQITKFEGHHMFAVEFEKHWVNAIVKFSGLPSGVAKKLIHHPRFGIFLTKFAHRRLTKAYRAKLRKLIIDFNGVPPPLERMVKVINEVHESL